MVLQETGGWAGYDGNVRFGLAVRQRDGLLTAHAPAIGESASEGIFGAVQRAIVRWIAGHFRRDPSFEQLDRVVLGEETQLDHTVILVNGERPDGEGRDECLRERG